MTSGTSASGRGSDPACVVMMRSELLFMVKNPFVAGGV
jgi:hypothetical protein